MADVDLLIKLPEEIINEINDENYQKVISWYDTTLYCAIKNGTPLEAIKTDVHRHKMDFYPSDYTLINTLIDKWINKGVDI